MAKNKEIEFEASNSKIKLGIKRTGQKELLHFTVTRGDIRDLAFFFPDVNIVELQSIEDFHQRLRAVLESEMSEERAELQSSIEILSSISSGKYSSIYSSGPFLLW